MKVVIIGGGFAGLKLADKLVDKKGIGVTLIDKYNYHQFQPLFYQVATGSLDASNISFPVRKVFQKCKSFTFRLATVTEIKTNENIVVTDTGEVPYDILVLATGCDTNFFGNQQMQSLAYPMKSTVEALRLRNHLVQMFEDAELVKDSPEKLAQQMCIVVVGGGPTGVELSGAISEMRNRILPKDHPHLDFSKMKIFLIEGSPKTLGVMSEQSSAQSRQYLEELGVVVKTGLVVKDFDGDKVTLSDGEIINTKTVVWAAGVKGNLPKGFDATLVVKGNRIKVDRYSKIIGFTNVYAIGDIASMETPKYPTGHPQLANVAISQGKLLAANLIKLNTNSREPLEQYEYHDKGNMATVGRNRAVVDIPKPKLHFGGFIAWFMWMSVHLFLILGVKNKLQIFINWIYKYFTFDQNLRLIFNGMGFSDKRLQPTTTAQSNPAPPQVAANQPVQVPQTKVPV